MAKVKKAINEFNARESRDPVFQEIVKATGLSESRVITSMKSVNTMSSMDEPLGEEDFTLGDTITDDTFKADDSGVSEKIDAVNQILDTLAPKEKMVIQLLYGVGGTGEKTIEEISETIGLGKERIRQIREAALRKLRGGPRSRFLKKFI
jgi:RNA polymerase primary sigma factor